MSVLWKHSGASRFCNETAALEIVRIGVGIPAIAGKLSMATHLPEAFGSDGFIPFPFEQLPSDPQVTMLFESPGGIRVIFFSFITAAALVSVGLFTPVAKWVLLFTNLFLTQRNPAIGYGFDALLCALLVPLTFAPIGYRLSLDSLWRRFPEGSPSFELRTRLGLRAIQIQMAVLYFFSAMGKIQSPVWWSGDALWYIVSNSEPFAGCLTWARAAVALNVLTYWSLAVKLFYPFLIWGPRTRFFFLANAILLHVGIAVVLDLYAFSALSIAGHLAFFRSSWFRTFRASLHGTSEVEGHAQNHE